LVRIAGFASSLEAHERSARGDIGHVGEQEPPVGDSWVRYARRWYRLVGSSKKPRSKPKPRKREAERADTSVGDGSDTAVVAAAGAGGGEQESVACLADTVELLAGRLTVVERQLERALLLQHRTNTLLELLAGSAFDAELGREPDR
jgi:hypothetical protein